MKQLSGMDALPVLADALDEGHAGLVAFSDKLRAVDDVPSFWFDDAPVWVVDREDTLDPWPVQAVGSRKIALACATGTRAFILPAEVFRAHVSAHLSAPLSDAEHQVLLDLACGLSVDESAARAGVAVSTRRKQLQGTFRKLAVDTQAAMVGLAGQVAHRLVARLSALHRSGDAGFGPYRAFLPAGVRCAAVERGDGATVRYLDMGPVSGRVVMVLHPMVFPDIHAEDVALFHELGLRAIWPVRPRCLSQSALKSGTWQDHCDAAVADCAAVLEAVSAAPVPVVALVSSGGYATTLAARHPHSVAQIDFVSTCYSAGRTRTRDGYFGDFLVRALRQNGRMAMVFAQHLSGAVFDLPRLERTVRRIFRGSAADKVVLDSVFSDAQKAARLKYAVRQSIGSIRHDYLGQVHFDWDDARRLPVTKQFWHGAQDRVHDLEDLTRLADYVSGRPPQVMAEMGHLTEGASLRSVLRAIAGTYPI
ncbi:helix-turn-helix transcriptional regulator [Pseudooctadecabacter sp.]|uniref:helix-turn-helix transcriptional regulator n=1 Tax=Pseudooctadecabacter sp. TaxID=1966338 RepID=UPI0025FA949A|nr:hypothetical protein [Pseudooctadecabacter sp.]